MIHEFIRDLREKLKAQTTGLAEECCSPSSGLGLGRRLSALWDGVLLKVWRHELEQQSLAEKELGPFALLALGGFGRGLLAPYSDLDVMLFTPRSPSSALKTVAAHFYRDVFDLGWQFGFSSHTVKTLPRQLLSDPHSLTGALQARLLVGDWEVFQIFHDTLTRLIRRNLPGLIESVIQARQVERQHYGETVFILQPNVKRSPGGIRDVQLIQWVKRLEHAVSDHRADQILTPEEADQVLEAEDFLWSIRHWLHWQAGRTQDLLTRGDQWRLAATWGYSGQHSLLPVEVFMRDYFRKTERVDFLACCLSEAYTQKRPTMFFRETSQPSDAFEESSCGLVPTAAGRKRLSQGWDGLLDMLETSQRLDKPLSWQFWSEVLRQHAAFSDNPSREILGRFLRLFDQPAQLAAVLRGLHKVGLLERFIPHFQYARGLLQFNQYHHYTVDEHCLRAVEAATSLAQAPGLLAETYRRIGQKRVLHLALLLHDLGKGLGPDHCTVGALLARSTGEDFALSPEESSLLEYLVASHLKMNHLALRRDLSDEQLIVQFASEVGSPEVLQMMYVLTAADLMAVSPENWTAWKADLLAELFQRTARYISDSGDIILYESDLEDRRQAVARALGPDAALPFFARLLGELPGGLLLANHPQVIAEDLRRLSRLGTSPVDIRAEYRKESATYLWSIATREDVASGIFHRLTGALSSQGLEILSAQIYTLADGWILDKYVVRDPNFPGEAPRERLQTIKRVLEQSLLQPEFSPVFTQRWQVGRHTLEAVPPARVRVGIDNHSLSQFTIIEIFANDRPGLLYEISRCLYQMGCFVWRAKIGTFLDQVVDVFYVTDQQSQKITAPETLTKLKEALLTILQPVPV